VEAPRSEKYVLIYLLWGKATPTEVSASYAGQIEYTPSPGQDISVSCMVNIMFIAGIKATCSSP